MKLPALVLLLASATATSAAAPPPTGVPRAMAGYAFKPDVADYYPAAARALGEGGTVKIHLCYDAGGRPGDITVAEGSFFLKLDAAARLWAKAVRIKPAVINGQPQPGCVVVPVKFSLQKSQEPPDGGEERFPTEPAPMEPPPIITPPPPPLGPPPPVSPLPRGRTT